MIVYRIISKQLKRTSDNSKGSTSSSEEGRANIFRRSYARYHHVFKPEQKVKTKGTNKAGYVTKVYSAPEEANWFQGKPHYIEVKFDDGTVLMCHPKQLRAIR